MIMYKGKTARCPYCFALQDDKIEDFAIAGKEGLESLDYHECIECDGMFGVRYNGNDQYLISKMEME